MKILDGQVALGNKSNTKNLGEHKVTLIHEYDPQECSLQFWNTQPVPQLPTASSSQSGPSEGPIDEPKTPADVKQDPGALPSGFEWSLIDIKDDVQVNCVTMTSLGAGPDDSVSKSTRCCPKTMSRTTMRCSVSGIRKSSYTGEHAFRGRFKVPEKAGL